MDDRRFAVLPVSQEMSHANEVSSRGSDEGGAALNCPVRGFVNLHLSIQGCQGAGGCCAKRMMCSTRVRVGKYIAAFPSEEVNTSSCVVHRVFQQAVHRLI